jgi:hypothetical protein
MKKLLPVLILLAFTTQLSSSQPITFDWASSCGGKSNIEGAVSLANDPSGNIYVTGEFTGTRTFGSFTLTSLGFADVFIAKYSSTGSCLWATSAGGGFSSAYGGEIIFQGTEVYVTGYFTNIITIGTGTCGTFSTGFKDVFIASLDAATGNCNWLEKAGGTYDDLGISIANVSGGGFLLAGTFADSAHFGTYTLTSSSIIDNDIFVAKYNTAGTCLWAKQIGNTSTDMLNSVKELSNGDIGITGSFENTLAIAPGINLVSAGYADILVARLNSNGNVIWATSAGGDNTDIGYGLSSDPSGNIYITGFIADTANFGSILVNNPGNIQFFIAKYSTTGFPQWVQIGGNTLDDIGYDIVTDASGSSYVTGYLNGNGNFAGTSVLGVQAQDAFIAKFDHLGALRWVTKVGGPSLDRGKSLLLDVGGEFITAGDFADFAAFGSTNLTTDPGVWGVYLTRMGGGTVSLDETPLQTIGVFPNPASETVYINLSEIDDMAFTLELFSSDGKRVLNKTLQKQDATASYAIPVGHLPPGLYSLQVSTSKGEFARNLTVY